MKKQILRTGLAVLAFALCSSAAYAQATRTWVSGVGDDVNPCSRTAPCKTFAGAISKTAAKGEINAIDSGGFGAVTITKGMTIDGAAVHASILASGTTGVIINAAATDVVTLKNLSINGGTTGVNGVRIIQAGTVVLENCEIFNFNSASPNGRGISDARTTGRLVVINTTIRNNTGTGIVTDAAQITLEGVQLIQNAEGGVFASGSTNVSLRDSTATGSSVGVEASGAGTSVSVVNSMITTNTTGVRASNGGAVLVSRSTIFGNTLGVQTQTAVTILSFQNNEFDGNATNGTLSGNLNIR